MTHDQDMHAKVKENTIKIRKVQKEKGTKYEPGLLVRIFNFRKLDSNTNHVYYFVPYQAKKSIWKESFIAKGKLIENGRNYCIVRIIVKDQDIDDLEEEKKYKVEKRCIKLPV